MPVIRTPGANPVRSGVECHRVCLVAVRPAQLHESNHHVGKCLHKTADRLRYRIAPGRRLTIIDSKAPVFGIERRKGDGILAAPSRRIAAGEVLEFRHVRVFLRRLASSNREPERGRNGLD